MAAGKYSENCLHVGVLAIIGSFIEHTNMTTRAVEALKKLAKRPLGDTEVKISVIRRPDQISDSLDALIIPGGETTVLSRFLDMNDFVNVLRDWSRKPDKFTWGTCAGLIVMSNEIENGGKKPIVTIGGIDITCVRIPIVTIGGIDITCVRNAYGRQRESHVAELSICDSKLQHAVEETAPCECSGVFIRAPLIKSVNSNAVEVLCSKKDIQDLEGDAQFADRVVPVAVAQDNKMATTFHPELTNDIRWHAYFLLEAMSRKFSTN